MTLTLTNARSRRMVLVRPVRPGGRCTWDPRGLLGTSDLIMVHGQVAFDQELLVIRIEDGLADVLAGKGLDRGPPARPPASARVIL